MNDKKMRQHVVDTLHVLERNGSPKALKQIKMKIPTF
jgi:hypothetical protein